MTHAEVHNPELYADRTVQDWHRGLPKEWTAIDIDLNDVAPEQHLILKPERIAETKELVAERMMEVQELF